MIISLVKERKYILMTAIFMKAPTSKFMFVSTRIPVVLKSAKVGLNAINTMITCQFTFQLHLEIWEIDPRWA